MKRRQVIGMGQMGTTRDGSPQLAVMALGSCVCIVAYHAVSGVVGMIHVVRPSSREATRQRADTTPAWFADEGVPKLLQAMRRATGDRDPRNLELRLIGGAKVVDLFKSFDVGKRNILAARKALWRQGLRPLFEEVGGTNSRTVMASVGNRTITLRIPGQPPREV